MENRRFVIFTGLWPDAAQPPVLPEAKEKDFVVCADAGYTVCKSAGIEPDVVIGDFDSLSQEFISEIDSLGIERIVHPCEKDDTDTMLCVKYGIERGFERFVIVGGIGGDFGHTMANLQVLSFLTDMEREAEILTESERLVMADGKTETALFPAKPAVPVTFAGRPGAKFSVLSYTERSSGVFVKNAKFELEDAVLTHSYPIGVSNEFSGAEPVEVLVGSGRLLIIIADR